MKGTNRKQTALSWVLGSLALLGCAGTIAFGTLWCHKTVEPGPEPETYTDVDLDWTTDEMGDFFCKELPGVEKGLNYKINFDLSNALADDKTTLYAMYGYILIGGTPVRLQPEHSFFFDDERNDEFLYAFDHTGILMDGMFFQWYVDEDEILTPLPLSFNQAEGKCSLAISPFEDVNETVRIQIYVSYTNE